MNSQLIILDPKKLNIARLISKGYKNLEIANEIGTTEHVVKNYLRRIYDKLGFHNRVELALWYVKYIEPNEDFLMFANIGRFSPAPVTGVFHGTKVINSENSREYGGTRCLY